jgi:hypothetical protein
MNKADQTAIAGIAIGIGAALSGVALPGEFPNTAPILWHFFFWGGVLIIAGFSLMLVDLHWLRSRSKKIRTISPAALGILLVILITFRFVGHETDDPKSSKAVSAIVEFPKLEREMDSRSVTATVTLFSKEFKPIRVYDIYLCRTVVLDREILYEGTIRMRSSNTRPSTQLKRHPRQQPALTHGVWHIACGYARCCLDRWRRQACRIL